LYVLCAAAGLASCAAVGLVQYVHKAPNLYFRRQHAGTRVQARFVSASCAPVHWLQSPGLLTHPMCDVLLCRCGTIGFVAAYWFVTKIYGKSSTTLGKALGQLLLARVACTRLHLPLHWLKIHA
jgi:hypothetical protein